MVRSFSRSRSNWLRAARISLEPAAGGAKIQTFLQGNEWDVQGLEILEHRQKMFQVAPDSIESPAHYDLDSRSTGVEKKSIETRPAVLRPAHLVGVFRMDGPAPRVAIATELEKLVFARLRTIGGAHARVERSPHGKTAFTFEVSHPSQSMPYAMSQPNFRSTFRTFSTISRASLTFFLTHFRAAGVTR